MAMSITVQPKELETTAGNIETMAADYESLYTRLFTEVDNMAAAWQGADNVAFTSQIKGFLEDFQNMKTLMMEYGEFLRNAAKLYTETQQDRVAQAQRLTN